MLNFKLGLIYILNVVLLILNNLTLKYYNQYKQIKNKFHVIKYILFYWIPVITDEHINIF